MRYWIWITKIQIAIQYFINGCPIDVMVVYDLSLCQRSIGAYYNYLSIRRTVIITMINGFIEIYVAVIF